MASWKRDFASGLIILAPVLVTLFVVAWIFNQLARIPVPVDNPATRVALTLVVFLLLVMAIGYLMRTAFGAVVESALDGMINRLPGLRVVYNASKMAVETALSGTDELQTPVKIETWDGLRMTAFKTGKQTEDGRDLLFLPTAPNITTGFVVEVEPDQYSESNESVEEALTRVLSAGFGETSERAITDLFDDKPDSGQTELSEDGTETPASTDTTATETSPSKQSDGTQTDE